MGFDWIELTGNLLLFLLVFGMSATVDMRSLVAQMQNRKAIVTCLCLQFGLLPLLGFCVVKILELDEALGITLLVVTSSPGGSYSNL
jgi:predicted Na+-dependent transporter